MTTPGSSKRRAAGRNPRGSISRAQIVQAAHEILARSPGEQLTIRSLARELRVAPMSLYRHIDGKDDVLDEVVDDLLARVAPPRVKPTEWRRYLRDAAEALREFLVAQPAALHVYLRHPVASPAAVARMNAMLHALRVAGCTDRQAERAYASIHTYTVGFAALEANRGSYVAPESDLQKRLATFTTSRQFLAGIGFLLDGIEANIASRGTR